MDYGLSNREQLQHRLEQAEGALQRCERRAVASRYAGAIMHEVNNPLEAITNLVYLTKLQSHDPDHVAANMAIIEEQLRTLGNVTNQALAYHREQADPSRFDLIEITESALKLHWGRLEARNVNVTKHFHGPAIASVRRSDILQVLSNLILNALDALPEHDPQFCVRVHGRASAVHITITDNGCGMPDHVVAQLFEPYVTTKSSGTGLGLWLSKEIVGRHRGTLRVRTSQKAKRRGTTFRISLPL